MEICAIKRKSLDMARPDLKHCVRGCPLGVTRTIFFNFTSKRLKLYYKKTLKRFFSENTQKFRKPTALHKINKFYNNSKEKQIESF